MVLHSGGLLALAGGSVDANFVQPDEKDGDIQLVLLNHLAGWAEGYERQQCRYSSSCFYTGVQEGANDFSIDPLLLMMLMSRLFTSTLLPSPTVSIRLLHLTSLLIFQSLTSSSTTSSRQK